MQYLFKQAVKIEARFYSLGLHFVPPEHVNHRFFQILLKAGLVVKPSSPSEDAPKLKMDLDSLPPGVKDHAERVLKSNEKRKSDSVDLVSKVENEGGSEEHSPQASADPLLSSPESPKKEKSEEPKPKKRK